MLFCETVNICNNDCIVCPYGRMTRKKETMSLELFKKVLNDYSAIGGGALSLTPVVGDVFLDKYLVDRIKLLKNYENINDISFTTNAIASDKLTDKELSFILTNLKRIYISIYGIDAEESLAITRKHNYSRALQNIHRIISLTANPQKIQLGFRCIKKHDKNTIQAWINQHFGFKIAFDHIDSYANWGGAIDVRNHLPFHGKWQPVKENLSQCLIPLIAAQIYSNGDISFCPCCDYDSVHELHLGNIKKNSFSDIYNGEKTATLWNFEKAQIPSFCKFCSFHISLNDLQRYEFMFENPYPIVGG